MKTFIKTLNIELLNSLPEDIIINHIIPYTYSVHPYKHLSDIHSFTIDYKILDNYYAFDYNEQILMSDLILFCNDARNITIGVNSFFYRLLSRSFMLRSKSYTEINSYIIKNFHDQVDNNIEKKIKFLWGLLTPNERTNFINEFIIKHVYIK